MGNGNVTVFFRAVTVALPHFSLNLLTKLAFSHRLQPSPGAAFLPVAAPSVAWVGPWGGVRW